VLSDVEPDFVCKACGKRGADVRPDFLAFEGPRADVGRTGGEANKKMFQLGQSDARGSHANASSSN
jgi:hypothetical protein